MTLPTGVVTFLMTDIVGSTPLWERAPQVMDIALQRHDSLIDAAVVAHGGHLLRHRGEGDSTFCVFHDVDDALAAATDAQRRLTDESWHELTPIAVRMGVHSGEALIRDGEYHGRVINRTARVRGLAEGGQVFVSGAAADLVRRSLPEGTRLQFLRLEVLRGIDDAEAIHELLDDHRRAAPATVTDDGVDLLTAPPLPDVLRNAAPRAFAGREDLLAAVIAARDGAAAGPSVVLLAGEPGAGKTALAAVAASQAHDDGWHVVFGACDEAGNVPYEAIRDLLTGCVQHAPRSVLAEHVVAHGAEIGRLTNRLTARVGAVGPLQSGDLDTTRRLLADAVVDLVRRLTALRPLLLVVDDLQWADHNSLHVLERLIRSDVGGLTVIGTCREGHIGTGDFGGWLERLQRMPRVSVCTVGGLGQRDVRAFLRDVAGHDLGEDGDRVVAHLFTETGGNPFFMVEVLRLLLQEGAIGRGADGRWRVLTDLSLATAPHSIRAVVEERLGHLAAATGHVLEAAAVLGRDFDPQWIATMLDLGELRVLDLLEPAVRDSLVRETDIGVFEFAHALVQHTLYDTIGATRRGALHRRAAITLGAAAGARPAPAATVADHWLRTGRDDRVEVAMWSRRAGLAAMEGLAPEDAAGWFERALTAASDDHDRLDLLIDLGRAQRWVDSAAFRTTLLAAASLAERLGDGPALVRAALANHRGGASRAGEVDRDRLVVLEKALAAVGGHDSAERALVLATIAMENSQGADIDRSIALADEALEVARRVGDDYTLFLVLLRITEATRIPATLDRRLLATRELFEIAERLDEPVQLGFAAVRDIRTKFEAARFDQVGRPFAVLDAVSRLDPFVQHNHSSLRAVDAQFHGRLDDALAHAERARELGLSENDATAVYVSTTSMIRWDMGTLGEMSPVLERICRDFPGVVGFQPTAGLALVTLGEVDRAREILRAAAEQRFAHLPLNPLWAMTVSVYASLCVELGDADAAGLLYDLMAPLRGRANISVVSGNGLVTESLAALAIVAGHLDAAATDVAEALAQADLLDARISTARSTLTLARLHAAHGRGADARAAALAAGGMARELGMARLAAQANGL